MRLDPKHEHFCTLFNSKFLPMGLALYESLRQHYGEHFTLWVICMDETLEDYFQRLNLRQIREISLRQIEDQDLLQAKQTRNFQEYCWTVTPFTFPAVFSADPGIQRVTYLDADLYFFQRADLIFQELEDSGKDILITEHAYAPEYDYSEVSGRFCVQFITVKRTEKAQKIIEIWQKQCLEWCYSYPDAGRFGDQKYLDQWPTEFPDSVHILEDQQLALAPWNASYIARTRGSLVPVFYHFHGFRIFSEKKARAFFGYRICPAAEVFYLAYVRHLRSILMRINQHGIATPLIPLSPESLHWKLPFRLIARRFRKEVKYYALK